MPAGPFIKRRVSERTTPKQSEKTLLDFLTTSISCIFFLRGFFKESCFGDNKYEVRRHTELTDSIRIKTLKRGVSNEIDMILEWINVSVLDSLQKKYLKTIALSVILDAEKPLEVYESYLFNVEYLESTGQPSFFNGDASVSPGEVTKYHIFKLLKKVILSTQALPALPMKRFLSMRLLLNDKCPKEYHSEFFTDCSNEAFSSIEIPASLHTDAIVHPGNVTTAHHNISVSLVSAAGINMENYQNDDVLHINPFDLFGFDTSNNFEDKVTTRQFQASQVTKEFHDILNNYTEEVHDGLTQLPGTHNTKETKISCTCESSMYLPYSSLIECFTCFRTLHRVCYSVNLNDPSFQCINCSKNYASMSSKDRHILYNLRKLIKYFQSNSTDSIDSFTTASLVLGFSNNDLKKKDTILGNVIDAFSILIFEGLLSFKQQKAFSHTLFEVDYKGLLYNNTPVEKGKYFIRFISKDKEAKITELLDPNFGNVAILVDSVREEMDTFNDTTIVEGNDSQEINNEKNNNYSADIFKLGLNN